MSYRIWYLIDEVLRSRRQSEIDQTVSYQDLSEEERAVIDPYREYLAEAAPPWPFLSMAAGVTLGGFGAFTGAAIVVTKGWPLGLLGFPPLVVCLVLVRVSRNQLYERKKKQKQLYDTLRENPRRLLDPEYRAQFEDLVDVDASDSSASRTVEQAE